MTRSLGAICRGRLDLSIRYHPLGPIVFAFLAGTVLWSALYVGMPGARPALRRWTRHLRHPFAGWALLTVLIVLWLVRLIVAYLHGGVFQW